MCFLSHAFNKFLIVEIGDRLSEVGKDINELKTLSGSGVEAVRGELDERLNRAEKRVIDVEEAFSGLKERLEEVGLIQYIFASENPLTEKYCTSWALQNLCA